MRLTGLAREQAVKECVDSCHALVALLNKQVGDGKATLQQLDAQVQAEAHTTVKEEERVALTMQESVEGMEAEVQAVLQLCQTTQAQVTHLDQALASRGHAPDADCRDWGQVPSPPPPLPAVPVCVVNVECSPVGVDTSRCVVLVCQRYAEKVFGDQGGGGFAGGSRRQAAGLSRLLVPQ